MVLAVVGMVSPVVWLVWTGGCSGRYGQTIFVVEGIGRCQREGGPVEEIRPGDRVFFAPGENHWHGAAPNRFMTHIAIQEVDESGSPVTWGNPVDDDTYLAAPAT
jgi:hypothetical protein